ncbi:phosphotransferase [Paractinoplanes brasiliensis]|uniref:phosphotransferase n=2 Tax=Paractinoplanes brasiliensis TaxID=52695 RepID=UPI0010619CB1|nr:phosphotransferase [Actinoplanes brasiliensis]
MAGDFAVKRMVVNAHRPEFADNVEAAFGVKWRAWNSGVPMPEPIAVDGRVLLRDGGDLYRANRWVDGQPGQATVRQAAELLAGIHAAGRPRLQGTPDTCWNGDRWGDALGRLARRVAGHPSRTLVVDSHRDLDRKNTLRSWDGRLMAVDWDAAGPISAIHEAVGLALDWADRDPDAFRAAIVTYELHSRLTVPAEPWIFGGWVVAQGGWLDYNADDSRADNSRADNSRADNSRADNSRDDFSAEANCGGDEYNTGHSRDHRNGVNANEHCRAGRDADEHCRAGGDADEHCRAGGDADEHCRAGGDADEHCRAGGDADEHCRAGDTADENGSEGQVAATRARLDQLAETLDDLLIRLARRPARPAS